MHEKELRTALPLLAGLAGIAVFFRGSGWVSVDTFLRQA